ncbi:hypothetical protein [Phenylobacterium sp.]|uniref:hypothetical protein n=1 Tax=Phenylobacterium sp. TaxID=1871053 RepID=UPI0025FECC13|nr:hypothetical protein [Phenylobacterium sp.]
MEPEPPREIDADYRVVHGPWPRWSLQLSLLKLALRTGAVVLVFCLVAIFLVVFVVRRW